MADLYGVGCQRCNREIAAAMKEMPHMEGYLDVDTYWQRYGTMEIRPLPLVNGEYKQKTVSCVIGDDGWILAMHCGRISPDGAPMVSLCENDPPNLAYELWRGKVELR